MTPEEIEKAWRDNQNWKWWVYYHCKYDPRLAVRMRNSKGYSANYAHPLLAPFILLNFAIFLVPQYIANLFGYRSGIKIIFFAISFFLVLLLFDFLSSPHRLKNRLTKSNEKEKSQQNIQD